MTDDPEALTLEWQQFQQAVLNLPVEREKCDRAAVFAEPEGGSKTRNAKKNVSVDGSLKREQLGLNRMNFLTVRGRDGTIRA